MNSILITGCNRGIGLGLIKNLINQPNPPKHLIATCRDIAKAEELQNISKQNKNVHIIPIDLRNFDQYGKLVKQVDSIVGTEGLNVLFNNAGIAGKFTRLNLLKLEQLSDTFLTNTIVPVMLTKALYPALKRAAIKKSDSPMGVSKAVIINMSSILGSIANNVDGGYYPYRCSKVALNMATRSMSADFKSDQILCVSLHPGWVKTEMGGSKAPMEVETSASDIIKLMYNLKEEHNGMFLQHDGQKLDW